MPLPKRNKDEDAKKFVNRCMSSDIMKQEYPDASQRVAVCNSQSRAGAGSGVLQMAGEEIIYAEIAREVSKAGYKYKDPVTGEIYEFARKGVYKKNGRVLVLVSEAEIIQETADEKAGYPPNCNEGYVEKDGKCVPIKDN